MHISAILKAVKTTAQTTTAAALLALTTMGAEAEAQEVRFFNVATGPAGASAFSVGSQLITAISHPKGARECESGGTCGVPGLIAVATSANGSLENLYDIRKGRIDSAIVHSALAYQATRGTGEFTIAKPDRNLRSIGRLYDNALHLITTAYTGITKLEDLQGRTIGVGRVGSGDREMVNRVLRAAKIDFDGVKLLPFSPTKSADLLASGKMDAFFVAGAPPIPVVGALAAELELVVIPVNSPAIEEVAKHDPYITMTVIPASSYEGQAQPVRTIATPAEWVVSAQTDDDLIYGITKSMWDERNFVLRDASDPTVKNLKVENAVKMNGAPLHSGAKRFYREIGILKK